MISTAVELRIWKQNYQIKINFIAMENFSRIQFLRLSSVKTVVVMVSILAASVLILVESGSVHFEDCGSKANITELRVTGCTTPPCNFIKGKPYEIEIDAISNCQSTKLPYWVTAKLVFPFTILKGDACDVLSRGSCPVTVGAAFTYKNHINISRSYPSFHTKVKALVHDDAGESVICLILDVQILKKTSTHSQWILG